MAIQWFPGHMNLTRKAIAERIKDIDVVIELLDARLPGSSANPMLAELTGHKPTLKMLNKQDLADPERTAQWLDHYNAQPDTRAIALDASETRAGAASWSTACHALAPNRGGMAKPMRVLICGVPNVGKSTLINTLTRQAPGQDRRRSRHHQAGAAHHAGRRLLPVRHARHAVAAHHRGQERLQPGRQRRDRPQCLRRGRSGAGTAGLPAPALRRRCCEARFKLDAGIAPLQDEEVLEAIGRQRGALLGKGRVNLQKAAEIVMTEFRAGNLGRITLETPAEFAQWLAEGEEKEAQRQAKKAARKAKPRSGAPTLDAPDAAD